MNTYDDFLAYLKHHEEPSEAGLEVRSGPEDGRIFPLRPGRLTIGRQSDCEIALLYDLTVSRRHAYLEVQADGVAIEDAGSTHGTYVNGARVEERVPVGGEDEIQLGSTRFTLRQEILSGTVKGSR